MPQAAFGKVKQPWPKLAVVPVRSKAPLELTLALLKGAQQEVKTQTLGDRAVRRSPRLAWDVLVKLYGDEATLKQRIGELKATAPQGVAELIALADKYASGWRPSDRDDEGRL